VSSPWISSSVSGSLGEPSTFFRIDFFLIVEGEGWITGWIDAGEELLFPLPEM